MKKETLIKIKFTKSDVEEYAIEYAALNNQDKSHIEAAIKGFVTECKRKEMF